MDSGVQRLLHPLCPLPRPRWFLCPQTNLTAPRQGALCEDTPAHTRALPPPLPRAMFSGHRSAGARVSRGLRPSGGGQVPSNHFAGTAETSHTKPTGSRVSRETEAPRALQEEMVLACGGARRNPHPAFGHVGVQCDLQSPHPRWATPSPEAAAAWDPQT